MNTKDIAQKWLDAANKRDSQAALPLFAADVTVYDPGLPKPLKGHKEWQQNADGAWWKAFPDLTFHKTSLLTGQDSFAMEVVLKGTHSGPLDTPMGSFPASNRKFEVKAAAFWKVNAQGEITEEHRYFDLMGFMAQLGLIPMPAAAH